MSDAEKIEVDIRKYVSSFSFRAAYYLTNIISMNYFTILFLIMAVYSEDNVTAVLILLGLYLDFKNRAAKIRARTPDDGLRVIDKADDFSIAFGGILKAWTLLLLSVVALIFIVSKGLSTIWGAPYETYATDAYQFLPIVSRFSETISNRGLDVDQLSVLSFYGNLIVAVLVLEIVVSRIYHSFLGKNLVFGASMLRANPMFVFLLVVLPLIIGSYHFVIGQNLPQTSFIFWGMALAPETYLYVMHTISACCSFLFYLFTVYVAHQLASLKLATQSISRNAEGA
jgi:hypothetical protein